MSFFGNKDKRQYAAASVFVLMVIFLLLFLTYIDIPSQNKDLIVSIVSMLVGRTSGALDKLFGDVDTERDVLIQRVEALEHANEVKAAEFRVIKEENDQLLRLLVGRIDIGAKELKEPPK